jgi:very-short-patch-repair endonuclease
VSFTVEQLLRRTGGATTRAALIELTSRGEVDRALREGRIVRVGRGRYTLPTASEARRAAAAMHGVASHLSAAAHWGWEMKHVPDKPSFTVPRARKVTPEQRSTVEPHWSPLSVDEVVDGWVTTPARTFVDCCRGLPFDEALAVADSARRHGILSAPDMLRIAEAVAGPGRMTCVRVAQEADARAANPFESVLRAIALGVPGLSVQPQVLVLDHPFTVRPDLTDERLRLALEADSFEWHGGREALKRGCRRYNLLTVHGWHVLRFSWEDVMLHADYVASTLGAAVALAHRPAELRAAPRRAA